MSLIETQSADTLADWALNYVDTNIIYIFEREYPNNKRLNYITFATLFKWRKNFKRI